MTAVTEQERTRRARQPVLLTQVFRPMFLAAGSWGLVAMLIWLAGFFGIIQLPTHFGPQAWHVHAMLFGFVMPAVAGFLLMAIPNWTRKLPVRGLPLALLAALWLLGRIASFQSANLPAWLAIALDLSFPVTLLAVSARETLVDRTWRSLPMTAPLAVFVVADLLMHLEAVGLPVPAGLGWRLALAAPLLLISVVGGRIIPSFTRNWLSRRKGARMPAAHGIVDQAAIALLGAGLLFWASLPGFRWGGAIVVIAAAANAWRLARWCGLSTWAEPLLFILHVAYGWIAIGTALLGLTMLDAGVPAASAIHALTVGGIAAMILAVMSRVTLGHTGREQTAGRATVAMFILINLAALTRVWASWEPEAMPSVLAVSGACWLGAFGLFLIVYGPMLLTRPLARRRTA